MPEITEPGRHRPCCDFVHDEAAAKPMATCTLNGGDRFFYACDAHAAKHGRRWRVEPVGRVAAEAAAEDERGEPCRA